MSFLLRLSIGFTLAVAAMDALWIWVSDFTYDFKGTGELLFVVLALIGIGLLINRYSTISWIRRATSIVIWLGIFVVYGLVGAPSSYLFASVGGTLKDSWFATADRALGFDWVGLLSFFSNHSWLGEYTSTIYRSSTTTMVLILLYLSLSNKHEKGDLLLASTIISSFITVALSALMVATGPFGFYNIPPELYKDFSPAVTGAGADWLSHLLQLRDGTLRSLGIGVYKPIVQFPSFHTILSVLMILALGGSGRAFVIGGFYNLLILATVLIDGGHYLVDMIAGALIAVTVWYGLATLDQLVAEKRLRASLRLPSWGALARGAGGLIAPRLLAWTALKPFRIFHSNH